MEPQKLSIECSCELKFGEEQLSTRDVPISQQIERKYGLVNQAIHFLGASNSLESCTIGDKINEIKENINEFYFDKENKLIAIPNQITLPKKPIILDPEETDKKKIIRNQKYMDQYYEHILHQDLIKRVKEKKVHAFVMLGFQSGDCIKAKLEKAKNLRKENQCNCKADKVCKCRKQKYPDLNVHEKEIMEILEINDVGDEELTVCIRWLKAWKKLEDKNSKTALDAIKPDSWLYNKVRYIFVRHGVQ